MNTTVKTILIVLATIVAVFVIFTAGVVLSRMYGWGIGFLPNTNLGWTQPRLNNNAYNSGMPMMGNRNWGNDNPGNRQQGGFSKKSGQVWSGGTQSLCGRFGMNGRGRFTQTGSVTPLSVDQVKKSVETAMKSMNDANLELKEIMIFDNNAYARIVEKDTGIGAMELLVDPLSQVAFMEYGPSRMWNVKYGYMCGSRNGAGLQTKSENVTADMAVSSEEALKIGQEYLDSNYPGYKTASDADPFYGYYTIDILKDGKITGMLSVNGFNKQVFMHTWHGTFLESSE